MILSVFLPSNGANMKSIFECIFSYRAWDKSFVQLMAAVSFVGIERKFSKVMDVVCGE